MQSALELQVVDQAIGAMYQMALELLALALDAGGEIGDLGEWSLSESRT
ncbi:hypothetical protein [Salinicola tamaricis]|nr:hypothetical protein [Salinicola tamaricis]